jgi:ABC-type polar amino acid transport system ATPase subunit
MKWINRDNFRHPHGPNSDYYLTTLNVRSSHGIFSAGEKESGKTTLIAKIQGNEDPKKGAGLEYHYIDVRDEYRDGKFDRRSKKE